MRRRSAWEDKVRSENCELIHRFEDAADGDARPRRWNQRRITGIVIKSLTRPIGSVT
jgi:hypothetical protein